MKQASVADDAALAAYLGQWVDVAPEEARALRAYARRCTWERGATLFPLGGEADDLILLTEGLVRGFYLHDDREVNLRLLCAPAAALPYNSFLLGTTADEALQALSPGTGYRVRFRAFCRERPGLLAEAVRRELAERHFIALQRRLRMLQARTAAQRYAYFRAHMPPEIVAGTPAYHVASYLGITPESLSRVKADLEKCQGNADPPPAD